jgi:hypothetical protein
MDRRRTRFVDSFVARTGDDQRVRVDVIATEKDGSSMALKPSGKWVEVSRAHAAHNRWRHPQTRPRREVHSGARRRGVHAGIALDAACQSWGPGHVTVLHLVTVLRGFAPNREGPPCSISSRATLCRYEVRVRRSERTSQLRLVLRGDPTSTPQILRSRCRRLLARERRAARGRRESVLTASGGVRRPHPRPFKLGGRSTPTADRAELGLQAVLCSGEPCLLYSTSLSP